MKKLTLAISLFLSLNASAALYDRGNGMIYDSTQNITWLQDANYAYTSGYDSDGYMDWYESTTWAENLTFGGYSDWRLPSGGFGGDASDPLYARCVDDNGGLTQCEMGHLILELGNQPPLFLSSEFIDGATGKVVSFENLYGQFYWEKEPYSANSIPGAWMFAAGEVVQGRLTFGYGNEFIVRAWAVRDGDVAAVPIPAAAGLFGSGLLGLVGIAKRNRKVS